MNHPNTQPGRRAVTKTILSTLCSPILAMAAAETWAQTTTYPDKPIKWVVPVSAGGGMDAVTRIVSAGMATALKQPIVVDNRTGAAGTIGTGYVAQSAPDGYTVLTIDNSNFTTAHLVFSKLAYAAPKDLKLVATLVRLPLVLAVPGDSPSKSFQDFIQSAKADPGKISYGSPGVGSPLHVGMELLQTRTGTKMQHVPYRGMGNILTDLSTGTIGAALVDFGSARSFAASGRIKILAVATEKRLAQLPDVPTLDELEVKNVPISLWFALAVPAGTPEAAVTRLAHAAQSALESPDAKSKFETIGAQVFLKTGSEVTAFGREQVAFWESIVKPMAIKLD
ncbi:tripartite tricarboxylate transporter substrate binding protein [Variovorax sp. LjRoot84]|uniref:Bug family tripartite tricarboxylate transporter substrate binding protein n=1 Tax=Variovorax sp. LjRoot84 TaxID=3342340 RepID=UPI003ECE6B2F